MKTQKLNLNNPYLFIHGAYHGAWCWEEIQRNLTMEGYAAYALDLPGHGQDETPRNMVTFSNQTEAVKDFIEKNNLHNIILVAHSLGGIVASKLIEEIPDRIKKVIFLSGVILDNNEAFFDYLPEQVRDSYEKQAHSREDKSIPPNFDSLKSRLFNQLPKEVSFEKICKKLTPQPLNVYKERVSLKNFRHTKIPMTYVLPTNDISLPRETFEKIMANLPQGYKKIEPESDHEIMFSNPAELIRIIKG